MRFLKDFDLVIEEYEANYVDAIYKEINAISEMTYRENCFLNGLVRYFRPKKIIEIGVAAGGSTCVLLNAIKDNPESIVHSIDWSGQYYRQTSKISGWKAKELFPNSPQLNLYLGVDVAEIIEEQIKGDIDFLLLDTVHRHPAETLSFLSVFPYLRNNAIVVLHDVNLFAKEQSRHYATKLLLDIVVADKKTLRVFSNDYEHPNIAAFQVSEDTGKYIADVVNSLLFPWEFEIPERILKATGHIIKAKYPSYLYDQFSKSTLQNNNMLKQKLRRVKRDLLEICLMCIPSSIERIIKNFRKQIAK